MEPISPRLEPSQKDIINVLLQDESFLRDWKKFNEALGIPTRDMFLMNNRLGSGYTTMYEIIKWMLKTWYDRVDSDANIQELITILQNEKLNSAADLLKDLLQRSKANMGTPPVLRLTGQESEAMVDRNLEKLKRIDGGSYSDVFKIECTFDNKKFALKQISIGKFVQLTKTSGNVGTGWEYFRKLLREVTIMAKLEHPNIVVYNEAWFEGPLRKMFSKWLSSMMTNEMSPPPLPTSDHSVEDENKTFVCIKMELMDTNLAFWLENNPHEIGNFEIAKFVTTEMLTALAFIHSKKIIHRDLKPNNILIKVQDNGLTVKLGDFGLSREMKETDTSLTVQVGGRIFCSPEMERGARYDFKTDIFSVGLICIFMLNRFKSLKEMERAFENIRKGDLKIVDHIQKNYRKNFDLLRRMLDSLPQNRPTAAEALAQ